jgi:hypothetical protein
MQYFMGSQGNRVSEQALSTDIVYQQETRQCNSPACCKCQREQMMMLPHRNSTQLIGIQRRAHRQKGFVVS